MAASDREERKQNGWNRSRRLSLQRSRTGGCGFNLCSCECVIADDIGSVLSRDVDARAVGTLGRARVLLKPLVEYGLAAIERVELVLSRERLGSPIGHELFEDAWAREELFEARDVPGLAVDGGRKSLPLVSIQDEPGAVA